MTLRKKFIFGLIGLVVLIIIGALGWAVKTGKIKPRADTITTGTGTISGTVTSWPASTPGYGRAISTNSNGTVVLESLSCGDTFYKQVTSTQRGYSFSSVPVGDYLLTLQISVNYNLPNPESFQFDSAGPIHLAAGGTATINLTPQTNFKALVIYRTKNADGTIKGDALPGAKVSMVAYNSWLSPQIFRTFSPTTSLLDSRGFSYIVSSEITSFITSLDFHNIIAPFPSGTGFITGDKNSLKITQVTAPNLASNVSFDAWWSRPQMSRTLIISSADITSSSCQLKEEKENPGIVNFTPFCTGN